ncbi:MAG TPA: hypothetical protein VLT61_01275, partial [Anaeromyxobacteraceae bacterium]|nr:hypothetical protein [Anaeromyxobacteraceae bacterium]
MTSNAPAVPPARTHGLVRVSGDHREMGRQQGTALRELIHASEEILVGSEPFGLLRPRLVPTRLFAAIARRRARGLLAGALARHRPEQHERLLGIAQGAGVSPLSSYLVQGAELLLAAVDWRHGPVPLAACSCAGIRG